MYLLLEGITFEKLTDETLYIALEMVNSNPQYNLLEHNKEERTMEEIHQEFINKETETILVKLDETYIGVINFMPTNPKDHYFWIRSFLIHRDYQGYGFGTFSYSLFENQFADGVVRIAVFRENNDANVFWEKQGYNLFKTVVNEAEKEILFYEKEIQ